MCNSIGIRCSIGTQWYIEKDKGWIPAYAAERHSHDTNMLVGSTPRLEEHLASWTKGCEGQKGSGE